MGINRL